jgi:putative DNA primase/helicase
MSDPHANGAAHGGSTQDELAEDRRYAAAWAAWEAQSPEDKLTAALGWAPLDWLKEPARSVLAAAWGHPIHRATITLTWKAAAPFTALTVLTDALNYWRAEMGMDTIEAAPEEPQAAAPTLAQSVLSFDALRTLTHPPRRCYLDWLQERAIVMLYGPRGVGKSFALLGLSLSLTTGTPFLAWQTHTPVGVLYVDGEMTTEDLQTRAHALAGGSEPSCLSFLSSEHVFHTTGCELTLASADKRREVDTILDARPALKVLILDNVSCLFPGISEDKKQDWEPINAWLLRLRHRGITTLFGHHAGKGGQQRGTSGREDNIDMTIKLTLPPGHQAKDGCHFHWTFTKTRSLKGRALDALDVRLDEVDGRTTWTYSPLERTRTDAVRLMLVDGIPPRAIAEELGIDLSYVYRVKRHGGL